MAEADSGNAMNDEADWRFAAITIEDIISARVEEYLERELTPMADRIDYLAIPTWTAIRSRKWVALWSWIDTYMDEDPDIFLKDYMKDYEIIATLEWRFHDSRRPAARHPS